MSSNYLSEQAAKKRRDYKKQWNARNRDKVREHTRRYWERKAKEQEAKDNEQNR